MHKATLFVHFVSDPLQSIAETWSCRRTSTAPSQSLQSQSPTYSHLSTHPAWFSSLRLPRTSSVVLPVRMHAQAHTQSSMSTALTAIVLSYLAAPHQQQSRRESSRLLLHPGLPWRQMHIMLVMFVFFGRRGTISIGRGILLRRVSRFASADVA